MLRFTVVYSQNLWKYAVNKGLKTDFNENEEVRNIIRRLLALPFIPVNDVIDTFEMIMNEIDNDGIDNNVVEKLEELFSYVDRVYVRGVQARGRRRAVQPRFEMSIWNVYELVLNKRQRSTNAVEGWHSRFQRIIVAHHSGVWKFIENLKQDQNENNVMMIQLQAGHRRIRYPVKGQYKRNQDQIETIVGNYNTYKDEGNILTYLLAISFKLIKNFWSLATFCSQGYFCHL